MHLASILLETLRKSSQIDAIEHLSPIPYRANWFILSDFCLDDVNKVSDAVVFSCFAYNADITAVKEYVKSIQPTDLKDTSTVNNEFLAYIGSPSFFHYSLILRKRDRFLKETLSRETMSQQLQDLRKLIPSWRENSPGQELYFDNLGKKLAEILHKSNAKGFSWKLLRKIFIVSSIAAALTQELSKVKGAPMVYWISDRDAIVEKFDGVALDLMFAFLCLLSLGNDHATQSTQVRMLDVPMIKFNTSKKNTIDDFEELIRVPDFIAGIVSELNGRDVEFCHTKYDKLFYDGLVDSPNHSIIAMDEEPGDLYIRRIKYAW
jgi:hypothetical protein